MFELWRRANVKVILRARRPEICLRTTEMRSKRIFADTYPRPPITPCRFLPLSTATEPAQGDCFFVNVSPLLSLAFSCPPWCLCFLFPAPFLFSPFSFLFLPWPVTYFCRILIIIIVHG
ncbi:hypothetical protein ABW19_dt0207386 [Dactylella cylindrospora]|nr:hypothetical protein ABW19_dt0207386 [Dactylella cylindrospora]